MYHLGPLFFTKRLQGNATKPSLHARASKGVQGTCQSKVTREGHFPI